MKYLFGVALVPLAFGALFFAAPQSVDAACSANGFINSGGRCAKSFKTSPFYDRDDYRDRYYDARRDALNRYIERLRALIARLESLRDGNFDRTDDFDVTTRSAAGVGEDDATLRGEVDYGDEDELEVWFQYGESAGDLDETSSRRNLDEDDDSDFFSIDIDDLESDERYYFRAVAENDDGDREYGAILSFRTEGDESDEEPDVMTDDANDVADDSAELRGEVDMNDFNNGRVFFIYGEDEDQVDDVEDDYNSYSDVDEDGDDLQKVLVDNDLDGTEDYREDVTDLDADTRIYYRLCVEFENEDDDEELICGETESLRTDE